MTRTFESGPARRTRMPLMLAIVGASGSGKTMSALLLAEGIRRLQPGPIVVIDTESLRALKHSDGNPERFVHVPFSPPFGPLDYIEAIKHAMTHSPSTIIIDSMSHEHEGEGGVLAQHAAVVKAKGQSHNMTAWIEPKADHTAMKHFILQQRCNWIFNFRAKEKTKPKADGKPEDLGWQPIGAEDLIYEMDLCALLYPGTDGRPEWRSRDRLLTEQAIMKLPGWFRDLFEGNPQITADIGEQLARWAAGGEASPKQRDPHPLVARFDACGSIKEFIAIGEEMRAGWDALPKLDRGAVNAAYDRAEAKAKRAKASKAAPASGAPSPEEQAEIAARESSGG